MSIEQQQFGLTGRPFQLTPDPDFWFESATHRKAMAYLGYGLVLGEGFIVITGEIGAGKTTLLGHLLATLDTARVDAIQITLAALAPGDVVGLVARQLGCPPSAQGAERISAIEHQILLRAQMGKRLLIVIDEAQALDVAALEQLRMISNCTAGNQPVVQFLLLGQPEFRELLANPSLEQLNQRIIAAHHLTGMSKDEVRDYLEHRLRYVGWQGRPHIAEDAVAQIMALSDGIPRRINQLMGRALLLAAMTNADEISGEIIATVHAEQSQEGRPLTLVTNTPAEPEPSAEPSVPDTEQAAPHGKPQEAGADMLLALLDRLHRLEQQAAEQDAALKRILNLLIDWVETENGRRPANGHPN